MTKGGRSGRRSPRRRPVGAGEGATGDRSGARGRRRGGRARAAGRNPGKGRRPRAGLRLLALLGLVLLVGLGPLLAWSFLPAAEPRDGFLEFEAKTSSPAEVIEQLGKEGIVEHPAVMRLYARLLAPAVELEARSHLLQMGLSPRELLQHLAGAARRSVRVTFPEGFTRFAMAERLEDAGVCSARAFLKQTESADLLLSLGVPAASAEGYLFPSTYEFRLDTDPARCVERMVREAKKRFSESLDEEGRLPEELKALGLGAHEVLTLASIVEKETSKPSERARIARVFLNRLSDPFGPTSGRLQSDPTATYGCLVLGEGAPASCIAGGGPPSPAMLRDDENPYNTYRHSGLPPGPISNPGQEAVTAVLTAPPSQELFFVADGLGNHTFSETFQQHRNAIKKLRETRP